MAKSYRPIEGQGIGFHRDAQLSKIPVSYRYRKKTGFEKIVSNGSINFIQYEISNALCFHKSKTNL